MKIKLGKLIEQIRGVSYKPADLHNELDDSSVVLLRANNINEGKINFEDVVYVDKSKAKEEQYLKKGDIFICASSGSKHLVGKAAYINEDLKAVFGAFCKVIRLKNKDFAQYVGHYFDSPIYRTFMDNASQGTNINNIRNEDIEELEINWIDDISTQQKIVAKLDNLNLAIDKCKRLLELHDELIKSKFYEMFGDPVVNEKGWEVKLLKEITTKIGSGATPKGGSESYIKEGISLIRSLNVHDGIFIYENLAHINDIQANELNNVIVMPNDVLLNITGASVARTCIVPDNVLPARVNQHVSIIRCKENILNNIFINQMFIIQSYKHFLLNMGEAHATTRQALTKQQLEQLNIIVPPLQLQNQFAQYVETVEASKTKIKELQSRIEYLKASYMQEFFA